MMSMDSALPDLRQLEAFCAVMATGSMTGGARLVGRSQSMVTRMVQDLEAGLGFTLFHRNGPRITPTEQALRFQPEALALLGGVQRLRENVHAIAHDVENSLHLCAIPALAAGLLPMALGRLPQGNLPREVHVRSVPADEVVRAVGRRDATFGLVSFPFNHPGVTLQWIGMAPCVAVMRADDPLAAHARISLHDLAESRLLTLANPFRIRNTIERAFAQMGWTPATIMDANMATVLMGLARAGLGVGIVDPVTAGAFQQPDLAIRPLDVNLPFFFGVVTPAGLTPSPALKALSGAVEEAARTLMPDLRRYTHESADLIESALYGTEPVEDA
ncbi:LysR family transcriptional regulator [Komagataeibacter xylinus]|uniref:LysR family transcriptional regulator n=2 Tax=Komagataeibacter xylinus TaxID=28448 RepID=A0A857FT39_KOMXY|nr:LysR family transcriptional regulator [Komagataeibacter xylinus]